MNLSRDHRGRGAGRFRAFRWLLAFSAACALLLTLGGVGISFFALHHFSRGLPEYSQLADYEPPTLTRLHAGDGRLLAEYAREQRVFVPIETIPELLVRAFVAAEDKNFYSHKGVDFVGIGRAVIQNIINFNSGRRLIGASTITQQVAKNFLLTNEVSLDRKVREAMLAVRIERALSKDRILELYLNEIFLGQRSYGVAAAALNYFDKSLANLDLAEIAFLAGLPKAPNSYHPGRNMVAALGRRDYVLGRMLEDEYIGEDELKRASGAPMELVPRNQAEIVNAPFFAEEVRREINSKYGPDALYTGGLSVRTTLDPVLQRVGVRALRDGLTNYDRKFGWRGPLGKLEINADWAMNLEKVDKPLGLGSWLLSVVLDVQGLEATIGFPDSTRGKIPLSNLVWAREAKDGQRLGPVIEDARDVLSLGDIILVRASQNDPKIDTEGFKHFDLCQLPEVEGALVAIDPHTGSVLAMVGGWSFEESQFNRVTQARRQPGSAFKPFVYIAAIERGYTPSSLILDAPFVVDQGPELGMWKPENYGREFGGPATMRVGIEKSKNLMTVRLANAIGMRSVLDAAARFGLGKFEPHLSTALGSGETTLLRLTSAYAMLVNGGRRIEPAFIERIQNRKGVTIERRDTRECSLCRFPHASPDVVPQLNDIRERITDSASAFQLTWMLKGVVERGTARKVGKLGRPLGGKTGTTNDSHDAWFIGFSPDLAVGVYIGFDQPRSLGARQTGSNVAAPVFKQFMEGATQGQPAVPFRIPNGIRMVRIDADTGTLPGPRSKRTILEAFKPGNEPVGTARIYRRDDGNIERNEEMPLGGDGGLY